MTAEGAQERLEAIRQHVGHAREERILETLDVVVGHCAPRWRVWPGTSTEA